MAKFIDLRCDYGFKFCMSDPTIMKFPNTILKGRMENINPLVYERRSKGHFVWLKRLRLELFPTMKWTWRSMFYNYHHSKNRSVNLTQSHEILFSSCAFLGFISSSFSRKKHTLSINGISISLRRLPHKLLIFCVAWTNWGLFWLPQQFFSVGIGRDHTAHIFPDIKSGP